MELMNIYAYIIKIRFHITTNIYVQLKHFLINYILTSAIKLKKQPSMRTIQFDLYTIVDSENLELLYVR